MVICIKQHLSNILNALLTKKTLKKRCKKKCVVLKDAKLNGISNAELEKTKTLQISIDILDLISIVNMFS